MTDLIEKAPLGRMLATFIGIWFLANIVLAAVGYAFPDLPVPSSVGIVLAMVAAMSAGQSGAGLRMGRDHRRSARNGGGGQRHLHTPQSEDLSV